MKLLPKPYYVIKTPIHKEVPMHVLHLIVSVNQYKLICPAPASQPYFAPS